MFDSQGSRTRASVRSARNGQVEVYGTIHGIGHAPNEGDYSDGWLVTVGRGRFWARVPRQHRGWDADVCCSGRLSGAMVAAVSRVAGRGMGCERVHGVVCRF
eukprot:10734047-Lingulodinium_polyedra.AAC.1